MRFRHSFAYLALALVTALALEGCSAGTQASATAGNAAPATAGNAAANGATFIQVQSIDGSKITAVVGITPQEAGGGQQPGAAPDSAGGQSGAEQKGSAPEQPSGDNSGSQPEGTPGQPPAGDNQQGGGQPGGMGFTASDETITFTIDDSTKITAQSGPDSAATDATTLTLADIAVGDILVVTLSSDNVAQTIMVQQANESSDTQSAS